VFIGGKDKKFQFPKNVFMKSKIRFFSFRLAAEI